MPKQYAFRDVIVNEVIPSKLLVEPQPGYAVAFLPEVIVVEAPIGGRQEQRVPAGGRDVRQLGAAGLAAAEVGVRRDVHVVEVEGRVVHLREDDGGQCSAPVGVNHAVLVGAQAVDAVIVANRAEPAHEIHQDSILHVEVHDVRPETRVRRDDRAGVRQRGGAAGVVNDHAERCAGPTEDRQKNGHAQ